MFRSGASAAFSPAEGATSQKIVHKSLNSASAFTFLVRAHISVSSVLASHTSPSQPRPLPCSHCLQHSRCRSNQHQKQQHETMGRTSASKGDDVIFWRRRSRPRGGSREEVTSLDDLCVCEKVTCTCAPVTPVGNQRLAPLQVLADGSGDDWLLVSCFQNGRADLEAAFMSGQLKTCLLVSLDEKKDAADKMAAVSSCQRNFPAAIHKYTDCTTRLSLQKHLCLHARACVCVHTLVCV